MDRELNQINVILLVDVMWERFVTVVDRSYSASMLQMRFLAGSFGMVSGQVSSGKVMEPFKVGNMDATADYYVSVSGNRQDGFQDHSQQTRQRINANIGLQLGNHQEIRAYFLQSLVSEALPGGLTTGSCLRIESRPEVIPHFPSQDSSPV